MDYCRSYNNRRCDGGGGLEAFEDSDRKIRGAVLKVLVGKMSMTEDHMTTAIGSEKERMKKVLSTLVKEGFIVKTGEAYCIA